jgi:hypothetical protein
VTSGYCKWVKRAKGNEDPILITELETFYVRETGTSTPRPTEDKFLQNYQYTDHHKQVLYNDGFQKTSRFCPLEFEFSVYLLSPYFS